MRRNEEPVVITVRLDAATEEQARAAIALMQRSGIAIFGNHGPRRKRYGEGTFWDAQIVFAPGVLEFPEGTADTADGPVQATATRGDRPPRALPPSSGKRPRLGRGR